MIITIGRECGCDGDEVAVKLAEIFNIPVYGRDKLLSLAREKGIYEKYPYFFSEIPQDELSGYAEKDKFNSLFKEPHKAFVDLFGDNVPDCVIIGRCSNYAFRDRDDVINVFLSGDKELRIKRMAEKHDMDEKKAKDILEKTDSRRRVYHRYYTGEIWGNAKCYDLCIDERRIGIDNTVKMIVEFVELVK